MATDPTGRIQLETGYLRSLRPKLAPAAALDTAEAAAGALEASALPLDALGPDARRAVVELDGALWLDPGLRELVRARTAQLTGCADSLARHAGRALELGESPRRLAALSGWHRSDQFSRRERAALEVADALACLPAGGVAAACRRAADHFDDPELAELVFACATANLRDGLELALAAVMPRREQTQE